MKNRKPEPIVDSSISSFSQASQISQGQMKEPADEYSQNFDDYQETKKQESMSYKDDFQSESRVSGFAKYKPQKLQKTDRLQTVHKPPIIRIAQSCGGKGRGIKKVQVTECLKQVELCLFRILREQKVSRPGTQCNKKESGKQAKSKLMNTMYEGNKHLPYNFNRLKELEKERLLTDLVEENKRHKEEIKKLQEEAQKQKVKYGKLLEEQVSKNDDSKQKALLKENQALKTKIESLMQFKKQHSLDNTFKMLSTAPAPISSEQEKVQEELISVIDKLKQRLRESEEQMKVLHRKLEFSQDLDLREALSNKARQLEKLEYRVGQLNQQAEADRAFVEELKAKFQATQEKFREEKEKNLTLAKEFRRVQLAVSTNNDIVSELAEVKKERDALEKSLRDLSGDLVRRVEIKNKEQKQQLENLGYIEVLDYNLRS